MIVSPTIVVAPRGICPETGQTLPLEHLVESYLAGRETGAIEIVGGRGSGKSSALAYLAQHMHARKPVVYLDDAKIEDVLALRSLRLVIFTANERGESDADATFGLSPWGSDELIDYLRAAHPERCQSVMRRIRLESFGGSLGGNPELWRIVLDRMAHDESAIRLRQVLQLEVAPLLTDERHEAVAQDFAVAQVRGKELLARTCWKHLKALGAEPRLLRLLHHREVQSLFAINRLRSALLEGKYASFDRLPMTVLRELALVVRDVPSAMKALNVMLTDPSTAWQATAASILHATDTNWMPRGRRPPALSHAQLAGAQWPSVGLNRAILVQTNLVGADLSGAVLTRASAMRCQLQRACLRRAELSRAWLLHADLSNADLTEASIKKAHLSHCNLSSASLVAAKLCGADLRDAQIDGADFSEADLTNADLSGLPLNDAKFVNAVFSRAHLIECNLEGMRLREPNFSKADLSEALLTGSVMPRANFYAASLHGAGLADVEWERADLRDADLRDCSFFLGSTRSGLVDSPLACEGSRTGFYTDDFDDQTFKPPEQIRKANLRGADLRGASIDGVDFYLVDLRNARYDRKQERQFRHCGAILSSRVDA